METIVKANNNPIMLPFQVQLIILQEQQVQVALPEVKITPKGASRIGRNPAQTSEDNSEQLLAQLPPQADTATTRCC